MIKYQAEQYYFPACDKHPWFIVTICEETGTVDIQSDHGNWQYRWGRKPLKEFLVRDDFNYFEGKFGYASPGRSGAGEWFDCGATIEKIKKNIPGINDIDIDELESIDASSFAEFFHQVPEAILQVCPPLAVYTTHPQLRMFMDKCWPVFVETLRVNQ